MFTVASIAPTPTDHAKPTIMPFPNMSVRETALWFCTEWWIGTGAYLYEMDMQRQKPAG